MSKAEQIEAEYREIELYLKQAQVCIHLLINELVRMILK